MTGMTRLVAGRVRFNFEDLGGPIEDWIHAVFGPLDAAPQVEAATEITFRFADDVPTEGGRLWPLPIGHSPSGGLWLADHLGRGAAIDFPVCESEIVVDRAIDPWFFQRWLYMPVLKASLWEHRIALVHAAGVELDGHRIALSGWAGAGKSGIVLRLLGSGARFIGDDWAGLGEDGTVYPLGAQLNLNSHHRPHVPAGRWPGRERSALPALRKMADAAAKAAARYPKASMGLARAADVAAAAGKTKACLTEMFPGAEMSSPGHLDGLFFIPRSGTFEPDEGRLPEMIAASSRSELLYCDDFESAVRFSYPGLLDQPLFGTIAEEAAVITAGLFAARKAVIHPDPSVVGITNAASDIAESIAAWRPSEVA